MCSAGIAREQVCIYMCPWPRIQGAMFDRDSLLITYRGWRGEPRGPHKAGQSWEGRGDCIDCKQCVAVCPTGIDIRDGPQLECIQCALCIDACDEIMTKVEQAARADRLRHRCAIWRRWDAKLYRSGSFVPAPYSTPQRWRSSAVIMLTALLLRPDLDVNVLHDRNPLYVKLSDGGVRNGYTVKLLNKLYEPRAFGLGVAGLPGAQLSVVGLENETDPLVTVPPDELKSVRLYVTLDKQAVAALGGAAKNFLRGHRCGGRRAHRAQRDLPGTRAMSERRGSPMDSRGRHVLLGSCRFFRRRSSSSTAFSSTSPSPPSAAATRSDPYRKGLQLQRDAAEAEGRPSWAGRRS